MLKSRLPSIGLAACLVLGAAGGAACRQDMHNNPKFRPYREGNTRQLPEGTVARGSLDLNPPAPKLIAAGPSSPAPGAPSGTATASSVPKGEDGFPFKVTPEVLARGESRFNISCLPCHGKLGDGGGMIVLRGFRRPPKYTEERLMKAPSSYFYDVITNGFGAMSSYSDQLTPEDRWKVIAWIRVLQLSQRANVAELAEVDKKALEALDHPGAAKEGAEKGEHGAAHGAQEKH
ncbi:MAG TPA: cytochrome c [Blastocatellia bacterium]|nr:cytochrome c [Blastocatellia bacterium]